MLGQSPFQLPDNNAFRLLFFKPAHLTILTATLACATAAFSQTAPVPGKWQRQVWTGIGGTSISNLTNSPRFYQTPDSTTLSDSSYASLGDNYGARTRGFIIPAASGLYTFWVSGDDEVVFSLSGGSSKWTAKKIAGNQTWTAQDSFDDAPGQRSVSQYLQAGQSYFVELLHKEGSLSDQASVTWAVQETAPSEETNWAATANGGMAMQTTTYPGTYSASNAIDENPATYSQTNNLAASSFTADFRQDRLISRVELVNREDGSQNRLSNFLVTVEDSAGSIVAEKRYYETTGSVGASEIWTLPATVAARRVKVQLLGLNRDNNYYLSLGELRAFGPATHQRNWSHEAAATAAQSTNYLASYPATNAIDGNPATFNHTANSPGSSLTTELGADRLIDTVELINRMDSNCQNRLSNFRVTILDSANTVLISQDYYPTTGNVKAALRWELPAPIIGRKVKVELLGLNRAGNNYLHVAELNVWGREAGSLAQQYQRTPVPTAVMCGYDPSMTDDQDDDDMPDAFELANGLNPADSTDALADLDQDGINNITEYRAGTNPAIWDSVPGILRDEIWHNISGGNLTAAGYKAAFTHDPDFTANLTTTQAFARGEQYVRRIRGFITAPVTGTYQFWGAADDDVDLFLSTSASKFDRQLILDNKVLSWGNYDIDLSQKSRLVTLTAGQKYYFEIWHKEGIGGSMVSVAWKAPNGTRQLIPSQYLSSYAADANDQDDDYLKDDYEIANGLSITDDGKSLNSKDGAYGDLDGDGITNLDEMKAGTKANLADSDGDGVSDFDEANFFDSSTLANDIGPFTPVATLNGDTYTANFGEWIKSEGKALQDCRRGSITYPVTVPVSGIHAAKFIINDLFDGDESEQHEFEIKLNGKRIAYKTINILPDGTSSLAVLTPWLNAGETYNLELLVDNSYNFRRVSIDSLQILAAGGTDSNDNGTPDWVDIREYNTNGFDSTNILSKTSPATVEGNAKYIDFLNTNGTAVIQAPNGRFFTEVPLTPGTPAALDFSFENGAITQSAAIQWLPTNLLQENSITLRQGDSLLLTAYQNAENASLESYTITANGQTYSQTADQPSQVAFTTPGTTILQLAHIGSDTLVTNRNVTVIVLPRVIIAPPLCVVGYQRVWTHSALPAGAVLHIDNQVTCWQESAANTYTMLTTSPENRPVLIRHGATGPILGSSKIKSFSVRSDDMTGNLIVDSSATNYLVELPVVSYGDMDTTEIRCEIIIGGLKFADGATVKSIFSSSLDQFGLSKLHFNQPISAHSNCHRYSVWHNGIRIAYFN